MRTTHCGLGQVYEHVQTLYCEWISVREGRGLQPEAGLQRRSFFCFFSALKRGTSNFQSMLSQLLAILIASWKEMPYKSFHLLK